MKINRLSPYCTSISLESVRIYEFMSFNWLQKQRMKTVIYSIIFVILEHSHYIGSKQTILGKCVLH